MCITNGNLAAKEKNYPTMSYNKVVVQSQCLLSLSRKNW